MRARRRHLNATIERRTSIETDDVEMQYTRCVYCSNLLDITDSHPVAIREEEDDFDETVAVWYHFCSGDCCRRWKRDAGVEPDRVNY